MKRLLFVEDNVDQYEAVKVLFEINEPSFQLTWAESLFDAKLILNSMTFDLIILDGNLPDGCGLVFANELKQNSFLKPTPVMMVTARGAIDDKVKAFNDGVDDYMVKPYDGYEFIARIKRILDRNETVDTTMISVAGILVDTKLQRVIIGTESIDLTSIEFKILMVLIDGKNTTLDRPYISSIVWPKEECDLRQIDTHISNLRKKIGRNKIISVHGTGYKLAS